MPEGLSSTVRLFADDTVVYMTITSDADADKLQSDLDKLADWENKWLMKFHPEKCNVLTITKNRKVIKRDYVLHGHRLEHITSAKYLGVRLTSDMKWTQHINNVCAKANSTIGFLKRKININNRDIKEKAYKSLVRPTVEYASAAWNPYQKTDIQKIEMIQRRAARFVQNRYHNTSSVTEMLEQLEWPTLEERRKIASLSIMYKMMNDKLNIDVTEKLKQQERPSRNSNSMALQLPSCRTSVRKESFYPRNIKEWNALPTTTVLAPSLDSFKARLRQ